MLTKIKRLAKSLRSDISGNATILVAMGMPALIGGTGLAVDTAQWYMWKRELQYAVDQAAIAGAWARAESSTQNTYQTRATQEYNANLSMVEDFDAVPTVGLANYAGGSNNSVTVSSTATRELPFSSFLTGEGTTVYAYAQASFDEGVTFTSCLIATDDDDDGAITIGGSSVLTAGCGMAALSTSDEAIVVNGSPEIDVNYILSAGGIDDWFDTNTDDEVHENLNGLYDPFAELSPPNPAESQVARTYGCVNGSTSTRADVATVTSNTYTYWRGSNSNTASAYTYSSPKPDSTVTDAQVSVVVANGTTDGTTTQSSTTWTQVGGSGSNKIFEKRVANTSTTHSNVVVTTLPTQASLRPGTYPSINVSCTTTFSTGVYIIDGGGFTVNGQDRVTGTGVMFVLKNGAYIQINGGADITLTAIQASDLLARGVSAEDANKLAGMLVFEAREGEGTSRNSLNGNASTILNGTIYLPKSNIDFSGTAGVTSQCLMIAAATINITGNANMSTFCPAGSTEDTVVASTTSTVKLVA